MIKRTAAVLVLVAGLHQPAFAQTAPAAPQSGASMLAGPLVPGVCLLSREAVFANAKVAQAANAHLEELVAAAQAEVDQDRAAIEADLETLRGQASDMTPEALLAQQQALNARMEPIRAKADLRTREIEATRAQVLERIASEAEPVIAQVYAERGCGLLIDRTAVIGGNLDNDLTGDVVQALDAKIATLSFERADLGQR